MADIKDWENTAAANSKPAPPDFPQEDVTTVADLNDCMRENMAGVRRWYDNPSYRDLGLAIAATGSNTVTFSEPITGLFFVEQRVRVDHAGGTSYGSLLTVDTGSNIITVDVDGGGTFTSPATAVWAGVNPTGNPTGAANPYQTNDFTAPQNFFDQVTIKRADAPLVLDVDAAVAANAQLINWNGVLAWVFAIDNAGDFIIAEAPAATRLLIQAGTSASVEITDTLNVNSAPVLRRFQTDWIDLSVPGNRAGKITHNLNAQPIGASFQLQNLSGSARGDIPNNGIIPISAYGGIEQSQDQYFSLYDDPADVDYLSASFYSVRDIIYLPNSGAAPVPSDFDVHNWQMRVNIFA